MKTEDPSPLEKPLPGHHVQLYCPYHEEMARDVKEVKQAVQRIEDSINGNEKAGIDGPFKYLYKVSGRVKALELWVATATGVSFVIWAWWYFHIGGK